MRPRVVVSQPVHREILEMLSRHTDAIVRRANTSLLDLARGADALMVFMPDSIDDAFLAACPRLKVIAAALKGFDNFDVAACAKRGIAFTIVPDLLTEPTAELAIALTLGLARNVWPGDRIVRGGSYQGWRPVLYGAGLDGGTVGIVGYGQVGKALEGRLQGFGCRVVWSDPHLQGGASLDELLGMSDFVLPLLPLTPDTLHLFNARTLAQMKRGAYLINVGRGSVVDEEAVADALESGQLAGYAADVFEMEDWARADRPRTISSRLLAMKDRTLFTPHLGSAVASVRLEIERSAAGSILQELFKPAAPSSNRA